MNSKLVQIAAAVKALQAANAQLKIDGIFGPKTRACLLDVINDGHDRR